MADSEFSTLEVALLAEAMALNVVSREKHVPEVERHNRTLKKQYRAVFNLPPLGKMPILMVAEPVRCANFWLHAFPAEDEVFDYISPRVLVLGISVDASKHCVVPFGQYAQLHQELDNSIAPRSVGAIALRLTGNAQEGHYSYSLETGKRVTRNNWIEVLMTDEVIGRVERIAENRSMNKLAYGNRQYAEKKSDEDGKDDVVFLSIGSYDDVSDGGSEIDADSKDSQSDHNEQEPENPEARDSRRVT